jgi:hypothetical protein
MRAPVTVSCVRAKQPDASEANAKARTDAWVRVKDVLARK